MKECIAEIIAACRDKEQGAALESCRHRFQVCGAMTVRVRCFQLQAGGYTRDAHLGLATHAIGALVEGRVAMFARVEGFMA